MASINSLMSSSTSSTSSIYGNSNIISGLASGMDTEAMIENAVSGIKNKIAGFNQNLMMLEWEQSAYRSIIDKMVNFSNKYFSFSSGTNLLSASFFDSATKITSSGTYANRLSVSGKTNSDIEILEATKATTASYSGSAKFALGEGQSFDVKMTMKDLGLIQDKVSTDESGNPIKDEEGNDVMTAGTAELALGGKTITVSSTDTVESVLGRISKEMGIDASYSTTTGKFYLKSQTSGADGNFTIGGEEPAEGQPDNDLARNLFGAIGAEETSYVKGENSYLRININGEEKTIDDQGSNTFDLDGMKVTINESFSVDTADGETAVSFKTGTDTDKIVGAIKSMVEDFNTMANEIKDAYTTKPLTNSSGKRYKPLTEEDSKDMSEEAVKKYEEKAKTGLLFADSNLSSLYSELRYAISDIDLEAIGISTAYANGKTTMVLDEEKLRSAVETDLDKVKDTLTREADPTDKTDKGGLMYNLQTTMDKYAKTTGDKKGVLIEIAGSEKSPASLSKNDYKSKMDRLQEQISRWQNKLSDKVDYYTRQFTALEKLISEMNSQSSALYGMMGY